MNKVIFKRFARGFFAGGIGAVSAMLAAGVTIKDFQDIETIAYAALVAFTSGGLQAIDKLLRWRDEAPQ